MSTPVAHLWRPSDSRIAVLDAFVPVPRGSTISAPPPLNWAAKDPRDTLDYQFDIRPAIIGNDGDSISSVDVTIAPDIAGGLTIDSSIADGSRVVLWLSGGASNTVYTVTLSIRTSSGRAIQRSVLLPVLSLSTAGVPANAIQIDGGLMLTDQNGNPVLAVS